MDINEKIRIKVNGVKQAGHVFGKQGKAALLFVHGGPGNPNRHKIIDKLSPLGEHTLVCAYDQRGTGGSYHPFMKDSAFRIDDFVTDIREWAEYLKSHYGVTAVILIGESWGSYIGSLAIKKYPTLFDAYVGYGQLVSMSRTLDAQYAALKKRLQGEKLKDFLTIAPPKDGKFASEEDASLFHSLLYPAFEPEDYPSYEEREIIPFNKSGEYGYFERRGFKKGTRRLSKVYGNLTGLTLEDNANYEIPYYVFAGDEDFITPFELSKNYLLNEVKAPRKGFVEFKGAGHMLAFEQPDKFIVEIERLVLNLLD